MQLSIIIVNYEAWDKLANCLHSLCPLFDVALSLEVIVVDNVSPTNRLATFQTDFPRVRFFSNTGNNGFANGCNYGASMSQGDTFLFLNPDTIVNGEAIREMYNALQAFEAITVLSCQQTDVQGNLSKSGASFKQFGLTKLRSSKQKSKLYLSDNLEEVDWVSGSVFMIEKIDFQNYNGWNEDYWMYCEDEDFCRRIHQKGGHAFLLKSPTIIHAHGGSSRINLKISALTKTEVIISTHLLFHNFTAGWKGVLLNLYIAFSVLIEHLLYAVLSLPLFFVKKLRVKSLIFFKLLYYYGYALGQRSWKSPRLRAYSNISL